MRAALLGLAWLSLGWMSAPQGGLSGEARAYRDEGLKAQQAGELHDAIAKYQKALLLDPAYATAYNDLGVSFEALGQLEQAKRAYLQCLDVNRRYPSAYANLAMLHERQGDFDTALMYWQRRAELGSADDPWTAKAKQRIGELLTKRPTEAVTVFSPEQSSLPPAPPKPAPALLEIRKSSAELEIDVSRLTRELSTVYFDLGVAYTELQAYPKAIEAYEKAVALDPLHAQAHAHLGLLYKHVRNDADKATGHLQTYLQLNPQAKDREELESLLALMQRTQAKTSSVPSETWGKP